MTLPAPEVAGLADALALIADVPDFPEPGILFKDITPLLADHAALAAVVAAQAAPGRGDTGGGVVAKVVGME